MAAKVQVVVEAKDAASGVLRGIGNQFGAIGGFIEQLTGSTMAWGNVATEATQMVIQWTKQAIEQTMKYASEVRDLALASGTTAESSSRLIQVLDDYELSAQDAMTATRFLTRQGLAPTVETIADLADKYNLLTTAQEKNQFILDNLGRGGMKWANMLSQGGDAIRALNAGVNENLILSDEQIKRTEEYRLAVDNLSDAWQGLQTTVGIKVIPVLSDVMNIMAEGSSRNKIQLAQLISPFATIYTWIKLINDEEQKRKGNTNDINSAAMSYQAWAEQIKNTEERQKLLNDAIEEIDWKSLISGIQNYQRESERYNQTNSELVANERKLYDERAILSAQLRDTAKRYGENSQEAQDLRDRIAEMSGEIMQNRDAMLENTKAAQAWAAQMLFSMVQAQLAVDGFQPDEGKFLIALGGALDLFDQKTVDVMTHVNDVISQGVDPGNMESSIATIAGLWNGLSDSITGNPIKAQISTQDVDRDIGFLERNVRTLDTAQATIGITADATQAVTDIGTIQTQMDTLNGATITTRFVANTGAATNAVNTLLDQVKAVAGTWEITFKISSGSQSIPNARAFVEPLVPAGYTLGEKIAPSSGSASAPSGQSLTGGTNYIYGNVQMVVNSDAMDVIGIR